MLMSAVGSVNPGVADLFNWLSNTQPAPVSSALSSPAVQSALQSSSPADLVQLSQQALQLQQAGSLFGSPDSAEPSATPESLLLQALTSSASEGESTSTAAAATSALALEQAYQLFGTNSSSGTGGRTYSFVG
jgi:hypothetical protein